MQKVIGVDFQRQWNKNNTVWMITGYWGTDNYWVSEADSNELINIVDLINNQAKPNIKKGMSIYASKASETPRFKLKEFIKDNELKKTSRNQYADIIIVNKGYFNQLKEYLKIKDVDFLTETFTKNTLKTIVKKSNLNNSTINTYNEAKDFNTLAFVRTRRENLEKEFKNNNAAKIEYDNNTHTVTGILIDFYREQRLVELLNVIVNNKERIKKGLVNFIFDEDFIVDLNKEGIELDDDYLQTLKDMLFSSDKSNVKLGFEMMANLVVTQPMLLSVSFLLNELFHTKGFRPSYYSGSNSNLKNLLKLLKTRGIAWERDWKTFGTGLRMNFKDGKEGEIVKQFLLDNINREFKLSNSAAESLVDIVFTTEAQ